MGQAVGRERNIGLGGAADFFAQFDGGAEIFGSDIGIGGLGNGGFAKDPAAAFYFLPAGGLGKETFCFPPAKKRHRGRLG